MKFTTEDTDFKAVIGLTPSKDDTGINLFVDVSEHKNEDLNRRHYILRVLHNGEIVVFKGNKNIGFKTDDDGHVKVTFRE